jgi:hypothetical protein
MYKNAKMVPVETIPGIGGGREEKQWRSWIHMWYIWYIVRNFVNTTMYPTHKRRKRKHGKRYLDAIEWVSSALNSFTSVLGEVYSYSTFAEYKSPVQILGSITHLYFQFNADIHIWCSSE